VPFVHRDVVALRLSPEDAFYLHAVVGCLVVYAYEESVVNNGDDNNDNNDNNNNNNKGGRHVELSREQFWTLLRETAGAAFGLKCVATCHFRLVAEIRFAIRRGFSFVSSTSVVGALGLLRVSFAGKQGREEIIRCI
jgi:hypothetical protein